MNRSQNIYQHVSTFIRELPMKLLILFACIYGLSYVLSSQGRAILGLVVISGAVVWLVGQHKQRESNKIRIDDLLVPVMAVCAYVYCIAALVGGSEALKTAATDVMLVAFGLFFLYSLVLLRKSSRLIKQARAKSKTA